MNRSCLLRLLRNAASVLCLIVCSLLTVLWARSYSWSDSLEGPLPQQYFFQVGTQRGRTDVLISGPAFRLSAWEVVSSWTPPPRADVVAARPRPQLFRVLYIQGNLFASFPIWTPVLMAGTLAAVLGIRRPYRFSLRTLLIATTFIAVVLGLMVTFR